MNRGAIAGGLLACVLLLAPSLRAAGPDQASRWIGKIVPPYPHGVVEQQGTCIGGIADDPVSPCGHIVDVVVDPQSGIRTILVIEATPHSGDVPLGRIVDAIEPPELEDAALDVAVAICQRDGRDDGRLVAVVDPGAKWQWLDAPRRVWRVDPASGRLHALAPDGVRCQNIGFGYDG